MVMAPPNKPYLLFGDEDQPQPSGPSLSALPPGGSNAGVDPLSLKRILAIERGDPSYTGGVQNPTDYPSPLASTATDMVGWGLAQQGAKLALARLGKVSGPTAAMASMAAGPIYEAAKGAITGRDPIETGKEMLDALVVGAGFEGGLAGIKKLWKAGKFMHGEAAPVFKELLSDAAELPLARPLRKMFPKTFHGETLKELFQPVIERAEPKLAGTLRRKELITDYARQAIAETSKRMEGMSLEERYHVADFLQAGRFSTSQGRLTKSYMKLPLDAKLRVTKALEPLEQWRTETGLIDPKRDVLRELELHKQIQEGFLKKLGKEGSVLDATYLDELAPFINGKAGVEQARGAFMEVMKHPAVSEEAKMLAKDLYLLNHKVADTFPSAIQHAEKNVLFAKLQSNPAWVSVKSRPGMVEATHPAFKGLYVTKDVDQAIKDYEYVPAFFTRALNNYFITPWKMNKVVFRVPSHFRNIFSNTILNDVGGLPWYRWDIYKKAISELRDNSAGVREFAKLTGSGTTFSEVEVAPILRMARQKTDLLQASEGYLSQMAGEMGEGTIGVAEKFGRAYQLEETWFKYAKYLHNLEKGGMSKKAAAEDAAKWTFNYGRVTPFVRTMRESVAPFATWTTKVIPLMAEAAIDHPLRVAKWMLAPYAITQMATKTANFSNKEWGKVRDDLPDYLSKGLIGLAPNRDSKGRAQLINYTWFLPGIGDVAGLYAGMDAKGMAQTLTQNPIISILADLKHNRTLSGAPIYYEWEPPGLKLQKLLAYVHLQLGPGILGSDMVKTFKALEGGPEAMTGGQLLANQFGVPVIPLVPTEIRRRKVQGQQYAIREMMGRARKEMMMARTPSDKRQVIDKYRSILGGYIDEEGMNKEE